MPLLSTQIMSEQTGAVTTEVPFNVDGTSLPATLMATNLAGSESVAVLFSVDGGTTFEPLSQDGADLTLTATANTFSVVSPLLLGVTKTATAAAGGVFIMTDNPSSSYV